LPEPKIRITIIDDSDERACEGKCGTDWSKPQSLAQARETIAGQFGDGVRLEYVDLQKAGDTDFLREIKSQTKGMPLPMLFSNGRPRIAGQFDLRQLIDVVEVDLEKAEGA
jgi:glutaredoxin